MCADEGKVTTENLLVHHTKELRDYPELALVLDNLLTVCFSCHEKIHDRFAEVNKKIDTVDFPERW
ncbi:HNH endonuclease [Schinkia azotoformans]|uniref:HNH endonuclease n=1 Tax=Schinkia azotoformans TaxID=1454 RepID=UPI002DB9AEA3|nr:HNH endonuclease [Schinkia azotoformans]MEC1778412.1 HNH endonuclease [Schinkia azotoformans]MED4328343.1 HNH endonuclease [Schinkia azotoformans]